MFACIICVNLCHLWHQIFPADITDCFRGLTQIRAFSFCKNRREVACVTRGSISANPRKKKDLYYLCKICAICGNKYL
jgi:hypothetical protein